MDNGRRDLAGKPGHLSLHLRPGSDQSPAHQKRLGSGLHLSKLGWGCWVCPHCYTPPTLSSALTSLERQGLESHESAGGKWRRPQGPESGPGALSSPRTVWSPGIERMPTARPGPWNPGSGPHYMCDLDLMSVLFSASIICTVKWGQYGRCSKLYHICKATVWKYSGTRCPSRKGERPEEAHSWGSRCALSTEVGLISHTERLGTVGLSLLPQLSQLAS